MKLKSACFIFICTLILLSAEGVASPNEHFGLGTQRQATAGGTVASPTGGGDVLENPALLSLGRSGLGLGVTSVFDRSVILLMERPRGYEAGDYGSRFNPRNDYSGSLKSFLVANVQHELIPDRLYGGLVAVLPNDGIARIQAHYSDETEQFFTNRVYYGRWGRRLSSEVFSGGLAYRFSDAFSFGIGILVMPQVVSTNDIYTPNAVEPSSAQVNVDTRNTLSTGTIAGIQFSPVQFLRFGLAFRDEVKGEVRGQNLIQINGSDEATPFVQSFVIVPDMLPLRVSAAIRGEWDSGSFLEAGGAFVGWGNAVDQHDENMGMQDVFEGNVGGGISFDEGKNEVAFGLGWRPSPTPKQTGRTNYVDNDRVIVSTGGGHRFKWAGEPIRIGFAMQVHVLLPEHTRKTLPGDVVPCADDVMVICDEDLNLPGLQTGNPGFPGYSHGGHIMTLGLDLEWYIDE